MVIRVNPANARGIVWLASYPKSGNTWMRAFLHALHHTMRGDVDDEIDINRMDDLSADDRNARRFLRYLNKPVERSDPKEIAAARPHVQADIVRDASGPVLVKTHNALINDHGFPLINLGVSVGAVYLVRNPLDVAISLAHFRKVPIDQIIAEMAAPGFGVGTDANNVYFVAGTWSTNVRSWTDQPRELVHVARYEDLLARPVEAFAAVAAHVLMAATSEQLQQAIDLVSFKRLQKTEESVGFKEKPPTAERFFREGRAGQWREVMSAAQVRRIVADHGDQMRRFGYLPD
jgi:hypothetical protein